MKKIIYFTVVSSFFAIVFSSCGSSHARCDAYGENLSVTIDQADLAQQ